MNGIFAVARFAFVAFWIPAIVDNIAYPCLGKLADSGSDAMLGMLALGVAMKAWLLRSINVAIQSTNAIQAPSNRCRL